MLRNRQEERKADFKKTIAVEDLRRRRDSDTLQLRKSKREESLMKRRNANASPVPAHRAIEASAGAVVASSLREVEQTKVDHAAAALLLLSDPALTQDLLSRFNGNDLTAALQATTQLRRMLSVEKDPPIQEVLDLQVLPRLVQYLQLGIVVPGQSMPAEQAKLAFEAAWAITNIASGHSDATNAVADAGAVPVFVNLLASAEESVSALMREFFEFSFNDFFFFFFFFHSFAINVFGHLAILPAMVPNCEICAWTRT
jgi:importin subunit alpha-1